MKIRFKFFRVIGSVVIVTGWLTFLFIKGKDIDYYLIATLKTILSGESIMVGDDKEKMILKGWSFAEKELRWSEGLQKFRWSNSKEMMVCVKPNVVIQATGPSYKLKISLELRPHDDLIGQPVTFEVFGSSGVVALIPEKALYLIEATLESIPQLLCLKISIPFTAKGEGGDARALGIRFYRLQVDVIQND